MSTGTIQDAALLIITDLRHDALQLGFTNDSGGALTKGDEVTLKVDGSVDLRSLGTEYPLGIVVVGAADGERVTVRTPFTALMDVTNVNAGTIDAGDLLIPKGTKDANGRPNYDIAAATNLSMVMALTQAATTAIVKVAVLESVQIA